MVFFFLESVTLPKRVRDLLRDPSGLFYFEAFLEDYFAEENLMFVYAVDAMKDGGVESPHWRQLCQDIFQKFIDPNRAIREVNISDHVRTPIMDRMRRDNGLDIHMFDGARREVVSSLQNDLYRRFKTSRHCARFLLHPLRDFPPSPFCVVCVSSGGVRMKMTVCMILPLIVDLLKC